VIYGYVIREDDGDGADDDAEERARGAAAQGGTDRARDTPDHTGNPDPDSP
jgi:hypothetical protein